MLSTREGFLMNNSRGNPMKRTLIGLTSIALLCLSSNAFAQSSGESSGKGTATGAPAADEGKPTPVGTGAGTTDKTGTSGQPDASQAKRKDSSEKQSARNSRDGPKPAIRSAPWISVNFGQNSSGQARVRRPWHHPAVG
jgi:hypothetical protein